MTYIGAEPIPVVAGGTGGSSHTAYAVICGGTASGAALQSVAGLGNSGFVLTSNGAAALPTFQAAGGGGITTIDGDTGSVTGSTISILSGLSTQHSGSSVSFSGSSTTLTMNVSDAGNNTIIGLGAGNASISATQCTGLGAGAFTALTSGNNNVAIGYQALVSGQTVGLCTAVGHSALATTTSSLFSTAVGQAALAASAGGNYNSAFGYAAGSHYNSTESSNISIGALTQGTAAESNTLRIGSGTGTGNGNLNQSFICGINGITVTGTAVLVSSSDQLGIAVSSQKFKENIVPMVDTTDILMKLRPVNFNWKKDVFNEESPSDVQYGLIAEEVAESFPYILVKDKEGNPFSVKYNELPAILLNEIQKLRREVDELRSKCGV